MGACPVCTEQNPERARFCWSCGAALDDTRPASEEERKVVSVLFVDLVGFTAVSERADPEDVRARLRPYHARVKGEIERAIKAANRGTPVVIHPALLDDADVPSE